MMAASLATARLYWQMGNWEKLAQMQVDTPQKGSVSRDQVELLLYKMQGLFVSGQIDEGHDFVDTLRRVGVAQKAIAAGLLSGAMSSTARARIMLRDKQRAKAAISLATELNPDCGDSATLTRLRFEQEWKITRDSKIAGEAIFIQPRKLFIDCGGYDGCSVLKFLLTFPDFDAVTFEPNPALWHYYDDLPTTLFRKAAYTRDGSISFRIDPIDGDGSSLMERKTIDYHGKIKNEDCPVIDTPCVDLSTYIAEMVKNYDHIVLKLDVEGAEYEILEKMISDDTLSDVDQVFCEFHYDKIGLNLDKHHDLVSRVAARTKLDAWDANYSIFKLAPKNSEKQILARRELVKTILRNKSKARNTHW